MAVRQDDKMSVLVKFDWEEENIQVWEMLGFSEDPNQQYSPFLGNKHLDSIIYAVNTDSSATDGTNFPVRGYMVGGTRSIWAHD